MCARLQVHGPFQMLNTINILVFRVTRTILYSLEACMASPNTALVVSTAAAMPPSQNASLMCSVCSTCLAHCRTTGYLSR